mgnify:CR=1 FL=1
MNSIGLISFLFFCFLGSKETAAESFPWPEVLSRQEEYVKSLQSEDGYLSMTPFNTKINPYFNNIALWGIVDNPAYSPTVKKWILWYVKHLNKPDRFGVTGSIYDYQVKSSSEIVSAQDYDSSDSYGATFLSLVKRYYQTSQDKIFLLELEPELNLVVQAIYSTLDPKDGLTYAKINYRIKYLMDNLEVFAGLKDWAYLLENVYNQPDKAEKISVDAELIYRSLQGMWLGKCFAFAKDETGKLFPTNTGKFYPDMTAQLMAIAFNLTSKEQAELIWSDFNNRFPKWTRLGHPDSFPWSLMVYAGAKVGDWEKVLAYLNSIEFTYGSMDYPWPWHSSEAGWYLLTLKMLPQEYLNENRK